MLWPLVLPASIAFWGLLACVVVATAVAPRFRWGRSLTFIVASLLSFFAFVPAIIVLKAAIDPFRFGMFHYDTYDEVGDFRVYRYLPPGATDIRLEKPDHGNGFRAKFAIDREKLEEWIDHLWAGEGGKNSAITGDEVDTRTRVRAGEIEQEFDDLGWKAPNDGVVYSGPFESDWGGFTLWYSESEGVAYQRAGYW